MAVFSGDEGHKSPNHKGWILTAKNEKIDKVIGIIGVIGVFLHRQARFPFPSKV